MDVNRLLADIAAEAISPYDGAFAAFRRLEGGRWWRRGYGGRDADGHLWDLRPDLWEHDVRRPILAHLVEWWERRDDRRERVEAEIRRFAASWARGGQPAIVADWAHWAPWEGYDGRPFGGAETNEAPEPRAVLGRDADLESADARVVRLELEYATVPSLDALARFPGLRVLILHYAHGVRDLRPIERLTDLRDLRIVTDDPELAQAAAALDLSHFPQLLRLSLGCHVDRTLTLDTAWIGGAPMLRELDIGAFVPASGSYADIATARRLLRLDVTRLPGSDAERLREQLPLTWIQLHDPAEERRHPRGLIREYARRWPVYAASPVYAEAWGVYNEYEAQDHLEALVEETDPALFARVGFDASAEEQHISAQSRDDLEAVLMLAAQVRSMAFEREVWHAIASTMYALERPPIASVDVRLGHRTATVVRDDGTVHAVVGADPESAALAREWGGDAEAFRRLVRRVVRGVRRDAWRAPAISIDGAEP